MTDRRIPPHIAVLVGVSASAYAMVLAGVTALQSTTDARIIAQRYPAQQAATEAARQHDASDEALATAADRYEALAQRYSQAGAALGTVETDLDDLATRAADLSASAAKLRVAPIRLPQVARSVTRITVAPTTHATTKASGG